MSGSRLARVRNSSCSEASPVRGARAMRWACGAWRGARRPVAGDGAVQSQSGVQAWHRGGGGRQPGGRLCVAGGGSGVSPGAAGGSWVAPDRSIPLVPLPAVAASGQRVLNRVRPGTGRCPEGACHGRKGRRCKGARQPRGRRSGSNTRLTEPLAAAPPCPSPRSGKEPLPLSAASPPAPDRTRPGARSRPASRCRRRRRPPRACAAGPAAPSPPVPPARPRRNARRDG